MPDAFENWICCDSDGCSVTWFHWECVGVTERPSGYWLCPKCSLRSTTNAELLKEQRGADKPMSPMTAKRTLIDPKNAAKDENKGGHTAVNKTPVRPKKGIAIKKAPKKTKPQWVGWVEQDSEDDGEEDIGDVKRVSKPTAVAERKQAKRSDATRPRAKLTKSGAVKKSSKPAASVKKSMRFDLPGKVDGIEPVRSSVASLSKGSAK